MQGNEEVRVVLVGNVSPGIQRYEDVFVPGVNHFYVGIGILDHLAEGKGYVKHHELFRELSVEGYGARVVAPVPRVYDHCPERNSCFLRSRRQACRQHCSRNRQNAQ